jgi:ketosteroid isomerase-like protein
MTSPEENVEIVRRIYDEYVNDAEALRDAFAGDFAFDARDTGPDIGVVQGFDAMNAALRTYFDSFDDFSVEIEEVVHADQDCVIVAVLDEGRMRGSRAEVRNHRFHVWSFRDGRVTRFTTHLDRKQAFHAAGLSEGSAG